MRTKHRIPLVVLSVGMALTMLVGSGAGATATHAQELRICFQGVADCITGRIAEFWREHGGLPVFGFPITPQREEVVEGRSRQVQWFERNRLELHPEFPRPYDVLLGRLGAHHLEQRGKNWRTFPQSAAIPGCRYFPETGHNVCGEILKTWQSHGLEFDGRRGKTEAESLALFGFPLSDAYEEMLEDGQTYTIQWFERARLELHPENPPPYHVLLGLLGRLTLEYAKPVDAESTILSPPRATAQQAIAYILNRGTTYTPYDVTLIVGYYWKIAPKVGVDPLLAIAQCLHETNNLKSWWAQRPRRNPAGYGVTGEVRTDTPPPNELSQWAWDEQAQVWRKGLSFATWEDAARAHIGRLLAYAIRDEGATAAQQELIREALALRPLPASYRGIAPTLRGLNGRWAYPGEQYADRIVRYANGIRQQKVP